MTFVKKRRWQWKDKRTNSGIKLNFKAWKHFLKEAEAREEDKPWYRGQSGPWGRSAGRVSQLQGENGGRGRNGEEVGKSSIPNTEYQILKYFVGNVGLMHIFLCWNIQLFILLSFGGCRCSRSHPPRHYHKQYEGCVTVPKRLNFRKISKGGEEGVIFNPKIHV